LGFFSVTFVERCACKSYILWPSATVRVYPASVRRRHRSRGIRKNAARIFSTIKPTANGKVSSIANSVSRYASSLRARHSSSLSTFTTRPPSYICSSAPGAIARSPSAPPLHGLIATERPEGREQIAGTGACRTLDVPIEVRFRPILLKNAVFELSCLARCATAMNSEWYCDCFC